MALNSQLLHVFKDMYDDESVHDLAMRNHPFMATIKKLGRFGGESFYYSTRYGNPQGVSGTFSTAQTNATLTKGVKWEMTRRPKYGVIEIPGEDLLAAQVGKDSAWITNLVEEHTDAVIEEHGDSLAFEMPRDGTTARGRRLSASTDVITLSVKDDVRNFKVGMTVVADDTADGSSLRTGSTTIIAIDEDAGTITLDDAAAITGFANNDYLFRQGDPGTGIEGLQKLFPLTAPVLGSDSFRGNDRGVDTRRLAGVRVNDTTMQPEEAAGLVSVKIQSTGKVTGKSSVWMNPIHVWAIARRLNAKVEYDNGGGEASYGFEHIKISTAAGDMKVYGDPDFPVSLGYVLCESNYAKHLGGMPHIISDDGKVSLRTNSRDAVEARTRSFVNMAAPKPGNNGVFAIASTGL